MSQSDIHALIQLLDDPDEVVFNTVREAITEKGEAVLHTLEDHFIIGSGDQLALQRLSEIIANIQYKTTYTAIKDWQVGEQDLLEGLLILNKYYQRNVPSEEITYLFSRLRQDIWLELNERLTALETVNVVNHILFKLCGYNSVSGEIQNAPHSLFDVLNTKTGTSLSIGTLYLLLARSLDLPIYGVNLPGHFLLCYVEQMPEWLLPEGETDTEEILFYINPAAGGSILDREEIEQFITSQHLPLDARFFEPCSNADVVTRNINALSHHYIAQNNADKVRELQVLLSVLLEIEE
jgi:regulator of sirC expression with transglutaminase-like and TPR domain